MPLEISDNTKAYFDKILSAAKADLVSAVETEMAKLGPGLEVEAATGVIVRVILAWNPLH